MKARPHKLRRFRFAIADGATSRTQEKRRREVADYVLGWLECGDIIGEEPDGKKRWLVVSVWCGVAPELAERFAGECPHYVRGTFAADPVRLIGSGNRG